MISKKRGDERPNSLPGLASETKGTPSEALFTAWPSRPVSGSKSRRWRSWRQVYELFDLRVQETASGLQIEGAILLPGDGSDVPLPLAVGGEVRSEFPQHPRPPHLPSYNIFVRWGTMVWRPSRLARTILGLGLIFDDEQFWVPVLDVPRIIGRFIIIGCVRNVRPSL